MWFHRTNVYLNLCSFSTPVRNADCLLSPNPSILPEQEVPLTSCPSSGRRAEAWFVPRHGVFPVPVFGFRLSAGQGFAVPVGVEADGAELFLENT